MSGEWVVVFGRLMAAGPAGRRRVLALLLALTGFSAPTLAQVSVVDGRGKTIQLEQPAERIATLAPHWAELVYAVGVEDKLVGTVKHSDFPSAVKHIPLIGDAFRIDYERLLEMRVQLVFAWGGGNPPAMIERLESLGIPVYVGDPHSLVAIAKHVRDLGVLTGAAKRADEVANDYLKDVNALTKPSGAFPAPKVFYMIWLKPLMTFGGSHVVSEVISRCGGRNVFADVSERSPHITVEALLARQPDKFVLGMRGEHQVQARQQLEDWGVIKPGAELIMVDPDLMHRPSLRMVDGMRVLCAKF